MNAETDECKEIWNIGYLVQPNGRLVSHSIAAELVAGRMRGRLVRVETAWLTRHWFDSNGKRVDETTAFRAIALELAKGASPVGYNHYFLRGVYRQILSLGLLDMENQQYQRFRGL